MFEYLVLGIYFYLIYYVVIVMQMDLFPEELIYNIIGYIDIINLRSCHCVSKLFDFISKKNRKESLLIFMMDQYNQTKIKYHPLSVLLYTYIRNHRNLYIPWYYRYAQFSSEIHHLIDHNLGIRQIYEIYDINAPCMCADRYNGRTIHQAVQRI